MAFRSSTGLAQGSGNSLAIDVPTGAAVDDIAIVGIYKENDRAVTPPAGFTQKTVLDTSASERGSLYVFWKRLTAADTGTYSFTWGGPGTWRSAGCALFSGRTATGDPFDGTVGTAESITFVSTLNVSTNPAAADGDAIDFHTDFQGGNSWTAPTNYTERQDLDVIGMFTRDAVASGSTGSVTATANVSGFMKAFLGVLAAAAGGGETAEGGAETSVTVTTEGSGATGRDGGAETSATITAEGSGITARSGGAETSVTATTEGSGSTARSGGSEASITVTSIGGGTAEEPQPEGGSETSITVTAEGDGSTARLGGSEATITITATGGGTAEEPQPMLLSYFSVVVGPLRDPLQVDEMRDPLQVGTASGELVTVGALSDTAPNIGELRDEQSPTIGELQDPLAVDEMRDPLTVDELKE